MEIIAVYWEPRIKTYGFQEVSGLALLEADLAPETVATWAMDLQDVDENASRFHLVLAHVSDGGRFQVLLVSDSDGVAEAARRLNHRHISRMVAPVDLLCFHGPHFGDRYGIADAALGRLIEEQVPVIASACSASSVYLLLPGGQGSAARALLADGFDTPANT